MREKRMKHHVKNRKKLMMDGRRGRHVERTRKIALHFAWLKKCRKHKKCWAAHMKRVKEKHMKYHKKRYAAYLKKCKKSKKCWAAHNKRLAARKKHIACMKNKKCRAKWIAAHKKRRAMHEKGIKAHKRRYTSSRTSSRRRARS